MADTATPPLEPVTLEQIKAHLNIEDEDQDEMLTGMIVAAREWVENYTGLILTRSEVTEVASSFCRLLSINAWPLPAAPTASIKYIDSDGGEQAITSVKGTLVGERRPVFRIERPA